ncbi:hypothetical protein Vafri_7431 [Volvox africanus]|uniref:Uncharacterized protein n=1 Tax=Volvox africanus TaxID=51714 RepID=A0A8J4B0H9_9CHLO|nr:hypothetical protein Vafri_7431 [Volvox africanus]
MEGLELGTAASRSALKDTDSVYHTPVTLRPGPTPAMSWPNPGEGCGAAAAAPIWLPFIVTVAWLPAWRGPDSYLAWLSKIRHPSTAGTGGSMGLPAAVRVCVL